MEIYEYQTKDRLKIISLMDEFGNYLEKLDPMNRTNFAPNGSVYFTDKLLKFSNLLLRFLHIILIPKILLSGGTP